MQCRKHTDREKIFIRNCVCGGGGGGGEGVRERGQKLEFLIATLLLAWQQLLLIKER